MSRSKQLLAVCLGAALIAGAAAQEKSQEKKIYRWVDKSGKVHISDQLPPEAVDQARKEYSASSGTLKKEVRPQLTPAEQALAQQQAKLEAEALEQAEKAKRIEQGMMINFETEQELQRSFDERTDLLQQTIASLKASIQSRRATVISALNELSDLELEGKPLPQAKIKQIKGNHALILKQTEQMARLTASFDALKGEFAATLERYRQLKSGQATLALPEAPASAASAPDQPPRQ
jgi:hypothetical protein